MKSKVKNLLLNQFIENPDNPQTVTDEAFERLCQSLRDHPEMLAAHKIAYCTDYVSPITGESFKGSGVVIAGNKRLRALKKIRGDNAAVPPEWFFDLTPYGVEARRRWLVQSNINAGEWDAEMLAKLYTREELDGVFSESELDALLVPASAEPAPAADEDAVPSVDETEPVASVMGEAYKLGDHVLVCADATIRSAYDVLLSPSERVDLMVTDPPYGVDYDKSSKGKIINDEKTGTDLVKFLGAALKSAREVMRDGAAFYCFAASGRYAEFLSALNDAALKISQHLIWRKNGFVISRNDYKYDFEPCIYGWREGASHYFTPSRKNRSVIDLIPDHVQEEGDDYLIDLNGVILRVPKNQIKFEGDTDLLHFARENKCDLHPTMKPVKLFEYLIGNSSRAGEIVLDPFGGSGTTIIACEKLRRRARVLELDPHYCDVIRKRWAEYVYGEGCEWRALTPRVIEVL